jgi:hypothetical protein
MRAYKAFEESGIEELGTVSKSQIPALIAAATLSMAEKNSFAVGLYRSEADFVEIRPVSKDAYLIYADRIAQNGGMLGWLFRKAPIEKTLNSQAYAVEAAYYFMDESRASFERKYG